MQNTDPDVSTAAPPDTRKRDGSFANGKRKNRSANLQNLLACYICGSVNPSGDSNAFYERPVTFDQVVREA